VPDQPFFARHPRLPYVLIAGLLVLAIAVIVSLYSNDKFKPREKIAVLTWTEDTFWEPTEKGAQDAANTFGVDLQFVRSKPDVDSQNRHIKELLASGIQGLGLAPNNPAQQEAAINEAAEKIPVITFDSDAPNTKRRGYVGTDDYVAGQVAAGEVRSALPDGARVIIAVGSTEMSNGSDRRRGLIDNLLDRPFNRDSKADPVDGPLKGNSYTILATITDAASVENAEKAVADAIAKYPDANCVVGLFSINGPAAARAIEKAGKKDRIKVIGFDESPDEQAAVQSGAVYSSVLQNQYRCGYETVRVLAELVRGVKPEGPSDTRLTALPVTVLRADNLEALRQSHAIRDVK
jgi:ribose transport system substrate-binding protein